MYNFCIGWGSNPRIRRYYDLNVASALDHSATNALQSTKKNDIGGIWTPASKCSSDFESDPLTTRARYQSFDLTKMPGVGFEPTHLTIIELKSTALDRSAIQALLKILTIHFEIFPNLKTSESWFFNLETQVPASLSIQQLGTSTLQISKTINAQDLN